MCYVELEIVEDTDLTAACRKVTGHENEILRGQHISNQTAFVVFQLPKSFVATPENTA
jgi:hypothetical protein